jgi:hypothetical protein
LGVAEWNMRSRSKKGVVKSAFKKKKKTDPSYFLKNGKY